MKWQFKIEDPSGETRTIPFEGKAVIGRAEHCKISLRDPTVLPEAATVWPLDATLSSPYWLKVSESSSFARISDLPIREAEIPEGIPFQIGETRITLESTRSPVLQPCLPSGVKPWLTKTESRYQVLLMAKKTAATPLSIYLAGETGTGKEVMAHLIHSWSDRASGPFVPLNCGALTLSLAESELFGHAKGAFTGAIAHRTGALMQAHGGTLFLDEIGDLPSDIQVKLLRFLENGEIRPVGADHFSRADVRLICATHKPLLTMVEKGQFRRDLYYRIASVILEIPPLRNRLLDIELLSNQYATELKHSLSPQALLRLKSYTWPGNVRELRHAIERACGISGPLNSLLTERDFEFLLSPQSLERDPELHFGAVLSLREMERAMVLKALRLSAGNRRAAAKILGVARSTLFEMLKRHRIQGPRSLNQL